MANFGDGCALKREMSKNHGLWPEHFAICPTFQKSEEFSLSKCFLYLLAIYLKGCIPFLLVASLMDSVTSRSFLLFFACFCRPSGDTS